jgi:hypothetical protein
LSGSAVFSALVDLLTLFFLWKTCASHRVALSRNKPVINNRVALFTIARNVDRSAVAKKFDRSAVAKNENKIRRKLHLSLEYPGFLSAACRSPGRFLTPRSLERSIIP